MIFYDLLSGTNIRNFLQPINQGTGKKVKSELFVPKLEKGRVFLYDLEKEYKLIQNDELIKYVLYTDQSGMWRIQAVTVEGQAFENRLSLPEHWRGVRDEDLLKIAGIEGCTFCHAAGFIGGNKSFDGVLEMARVSLQQQQVEK